MDAEKYKFEMSQASAAILRSHDCIFLLEIAMELVYLTYLKQMWVTITTLSEKNKIEDLDVTPYSQIVWLLDIASVQYYWKNWLIFL